jgi:acetyltransferase-like isoleucine patch superfamily enzyme
MVVARQAHQDSSEFGSPAPVADIMNKTLLRRILNRVLNLMARASPGATTLRPMLHRARGVTIGRGVFIGDDAYLDGEYPEGIEIQDGAAVSIRAMIIAHNKGPGRVVIEKGAFVGPHAVVIANGGKTLRIGAGAVIGAGCVISRSVAPRLVVTPAGTQVVGMATVSLPTAETIEQFTFGLRPLRTARRRGGTTGSISIDPPKQ